MSKQVTATAVAHKDIKGKELYYIKLTDGKNDKYVNVGKSTYDELKKLESDEVPTFDEVTKNIPNAVQKVDNKTNSKR